MVRDFVRLVEMVVFVVLCCVVRGDVGRQGGVLDLSGDSDECGRWFSGLVCGEGSFS